MSGDEPDSEQIARLMAAEILRRDPAFRSRRERERIERVMDRQLERQEERRAILEGYQFVVDDLLRNGWRQAMLGTCAVCHGPVRDRDLGAVLDELRNRSDEIPSPISGPALVCPSGHVSHLVCMPFTELEGPAPGEHRVIGECEVCLARRPPRRRWLA